MHAVIASRRATPRLYPFEIFTLVNFVIIWAIVSRSGNAVLVTVPETFTSFVPTLTGYLLAGCVLRGAIAAWRGTLRQYLAKIRTAGWITDAIRLVLGGSLMVHTYFWIKLMAPIAHPRLFDRELWELDRVLMFGLSPNIFFVSLFSQKPVLAFIDWSYAKIFFASMTIAFMYFLSEPSRRLRIAFMWGSSLLWIFGAWLYMAVPSLGPAFRFPDVWFAYSDGLKVTQHFQAVLMRNFHNMVKLTSGQQADVQLMFGVAAFPSLHVAFQTFAFLWMRRLWVYGQVVFGVFLLAIFIGSIVTGWHYMVDGIGGAALAALAYYGAVRMYRLRRWRRLHH